MPYIAGVAGLDALAWAKLKTRLFKLFGIEKACESLLDSGESLDEVTRREMELALGYDLRDVRIHETKQAGELARKLEAEAFTIGADIFAAKGKLNTLTGEGKGLLVHELTHAIQQARPHPALPRSDSTEGLPVTVGYPELRHIPVPQLAPLSPLPGWGYSAPEVMEAVAETAEQTVRGAIEGFVGGQTIAPVNTEEIAERVYRLMQQELLLEKDRR